MSRKQSWEHTYRSDVRTPAWYWPVAIQVCGANSKGYLYPGRCYMARPGSDFCEFHINFPNAEEYSRFVSEFNRRIREMKEKHMEIKLEDALRVYEKAGDEGKAIVEKLCPQMFERKDITKALVWEVLEYAPGKYKLRGTYSGKCAVIIHYSDVHTYDGFEFAKEDMGSFCVYKKGFAPAVPGKGPEKKR